MNFNNAINPQKEDGYPAVLMPSRSNKIKKVVPRDNQGGIGGATDLKTGTVYIPTGDNANERTIRYHEAMHAAHTNKKYTPKDLLDQALEDGRLHRYCSKSAESAYQQARRDEVCTALKELRQIDRHFDGMEPVRSSVVAFRAFSILAASEIEPAHQTLLASALSHLGERSQKHFQMALDLLGANKWEDARKVLASYFAKDFDPKPPIKTEGTDDKTESKAGEPRDADPLDKDEDGGESSEDESEDGSESDTGEESEEDSEGEEEESKEIETKEPEIAPLDISSSSKSKAKVRPKDAYGADLTPACDAERYKEMSLSYPLELLIKRLDMDINRVKLSMGRKAPLPVASGRKILARKLAGAVVNPTMRVFARPVSDGGSGTVLIDASGSMAIPEETLISFLAKCPALTLGFYNAANDNYRQTKCGRIFIYAANGYRASVTNLGSTDGYGHGNLIDYQAIAWLLKQPSPHYLVTDRQFTGPWGPAAKDLCRKLESAKLLRVVRTLEQMQTVLDTRGRV